MGRNPRSVGVSAALVASLCLTSCATAPTVAPARRPPTYPPPPVYQAPPTAVSADLPVLLGTVVQVTDGDTIKVQLRAGAISVRFDSIDAPEENQPWGSEARAALASRLEQQVVALNVKEQDRYERLVAVVLLGDESINGWMVQQGHAWAYRQYLRDPRYCSWEATARATQRGLWALPATSQRAPWEWRKFQGGRGEAFTDYCRETVANCVAAIPTRRRGNSPQGVQTSPASSSSSVLLGGCRIKGNLSQNGRIYHGPGSSSYDQTQIDTSTGERWFCSEAEAREAGCRAPR